MREKLICGLISAEIALALSEVPDLISGVAARSIILRAARDHPSSLIVSFYLLFQ